MSFLCQLEPGAIAPRRKSRYDAGFDICCNEDVMIESHMWKSISTGVKVKCPPHVYYRVAPRSGLAFQFGLNVLAGVVDSGYRGEVKVILMNPSNAAVYVKKGERIAQLIPTLIYDTELLSIPEGKLDETKRGEKGFGSSGTKSFPIMKEEYKPKRTIRKLRKTEEHTCFQDMHL